MSNAADAACQFALAQVGKPYQWGGTGPNSYDCSGLWYSAYKSAGIKIPRTTGLMASYGQAVTKDELLPGDLIFPYAGHVFGYIGDGKCVEAPHTGEDIRVINVDSESFWRGRRIVAGGGTSAASSIPSAASVVTANITTASFWNPIDDYKSITSGISNLTNAFSGIAHAAEWLATPHNWFRILLFAAGAIALAMAVKNLAIH